MDQEYGLVGAARPTLGLLWRMELHGPPELKGLPMELLLYGFGLRSPTFWAYARAGPTRTMSSKRSRIFNPRCSSLRDARKTSPMRSSLSCPDSPRSSNSDSQEILHHTSDTMPQENLSQLPTRSFPATHCDQRKFFLGNQILTDRSTAC